MPAFLAASTALIASGFAIGAAAQEIAGRYTAVGTITPGVSWSETAEIEMISENTCRIAWSGGQAGVCRLDGSTLSVAFVIHGIAGLGLYEVAGDGSMEGTFFDDYHKGGVGKEKLTPTD